MSDTILPVAKTDALQEDIAEFGLDILQTEEVGDLLCSHEALRATVAALTAENAHLREALTLGLGEQESVIAGLRAENERLREAVKGLPRFECTMGGCGDPECCGSYPEMEPADAGEWVRHADIVAALPSSRETTDG